MPCETNEPAIILRGDLHAHTHHSDGRDSVASMAGAAAARGLEYLAITDHSPRLRVANGLDSRRLASQWQELDAVEVRDGFRLLRGIEVDILRDGSLDQAPDMLASCDVVVASVHTGLDGDAETLTRRMVAAVANPHTLVLGHCTGRKRRADGTWRRASAFDAELVLTACAMFEVAVEVNARPDRDDPPDALIGLAADLGCLFSVGSDAHAVEQLEFLDRGAARLERLGVAADRVINCWPVDRLLAHSRRRR